MQITLEVGKASASLDALLLDGQQDSFDLAFVGEALSQSAWDTPDETLSIMSALQHGGAHVIQPS